MTTIVTDRYGGECRDDESNSVQGNNEGIIYNNYHIHGSIGNYQFFGTKKVAAETVEAVVQVAMDQAEKRGMITTKVHHACATLIFSKI
jgi:hypothetical protein